MRGFLLAMFCGLVLGTGCVSSSLPPSVTPARFVYEPVESESVRKYFVNGIPVAAVERPDSLVLMSFDGVRIEEVSYLRMWLVYFNSKKAPVLLDPVNSTKLVTPFGEVRPESPSVLVNKMEQQKLRDLGNDRLMNALNALSTYASAVSRGADPAAAQAAAGNVSQAGNARAMERAAIYDSAKETVSSGLLRKNTVFPSKGVQGFLYFRIPAINFDYEIQMEVESTPLFIKFKASPAE